MAFSLKAPGKYVQGEGELHNLGLNVKKLGKHFLIVCSGNNENVSARQLSIHCRKQTADALFIASAA